MTAEILARTGALVAAAGVAVLALAPDRRVRLAGLAAWVLGMALFLPAVVPDTRLVILAALAVAGLVVSAALAAVFLRWPWALPALTLAAVPARVPVTIGETSANLLVPLYGVIGGAALALAWTLWRADARSRELGPLAWPAAALVLWFAVAFLWAEDVQGGVVALFFFVFPFALLTIALSRLPWHVPPLAGLFGLLAALALAFAAVGVWQWTTHEVFWNPKVIVGNAYGPFYRVNSVFWDPSIYGRFLVVAMLASLVLLLFWKRPRLELALAAVLAGLSVGLLVSFSQSSFAALFVGVALAAALAWRWRAVAAVAAVAAVMIPIGMAAPQFDDLRESFVGSSARGLNRATSGRFELVENGVRIAADHPLAGVGTGGFKKAYAERLGLRGGAPAVASHNTPVTVAAETGVVGLALFAWLVGVALLMTLRGNRDGRRVAEKVALATGVVLAAILVHSLSYNAFFEDPLTWALLGLAAVAVRARERSPG